MTTTDTFAESVPASASKASRNADEAALVVSNLTKRFPADRGLHPVERALSRLGGVDRSGTIVDDDDDGLDEPEESEELRAEDTLALDDVSFEVRAGTVIGLVGPPGSGKTALLNIVAGLSYPTDGRVVVRRPVAPALESVIRALPPRLTFEKALPLLATMVGLPPGDVRARLDDIFAFAELEEYRRYTVTSSSRKRRRLLLLATMLLVESDVVLVDVELGGSRFREKCLQAIESRRRRGAGVVLAARDIDSVSEIASRVVYLSKGRIVADGAPDAVASEIVRLRVRNTRSETPPLTSDAKRYVEFLEVAIGAARMHDALHAATDASIATDLDHVDWDAIANAARIPRPEAQAVVDRLRARTARGG